MKDLNISIECGSSSDHRVAVGFHIINGVFDETADNYGISYCLDALLYEKLCREIVDTENGTLRAITHYGYSSFVVCCQADRLIDNLMRMRSVLLEDDTLKVCYSTMDLSERRKAKNRAVPLQLRYHAARSADNRLVQPLRPSIQTTFDLQMLRQWKLQHYGVCNCNIVLTGNIPEKIYGYATKSVNSTLPDIAGKKITPPKCISWQYSQVIISSHYRLTSENILCAEAASKWCEPYMARHLNTLGCRLSSFRIYPDYISEWCAHAQCRRGHERMVYQAVVEAFLCKPKSERDLDAIRQRIKSGYAQLAESIMEWNLFAGYNLFSGQRYHLPGLLLDATFQEKINHASLCAILDEWKNAQDISFFITAAR